MCVYDLMSGAVGGVPVRFCGGVGLDWIGLDWIGLDWIGLDWIGLDWIGLDWIGLDWIGLDWIGLDWIGLDWIGLEWSFALFRGAILGSQATQPTRLVTLTCERPLCGGVGFEKGFEMGSQR